MSLGVFWVTLEDALSFWSKFRNMEQGQSYRLPAEWEPQSAIQFTWPHKDTEWGEDLWEVQDRIQQCIALITEGQQVVITGPDPVEIRQRLANIPSEKLKVIEAQSNDVWARDHGPLIIEAKQAWQVLDYQFDGWGKKYPADLDNKITEKLWRAGVFGDVERREMSLVLEGGSIESDGKGTIIASVDCIMDEHRYPEEDWKEVLFLLRKQLGASRVLTLPSGQLMGDDTDGHIDTIARFCNAETIAYVQCDDPGDEHFDFLQKLASELRKWRTLDDKPYRLVPLPLPDPCFHPVDSHRLPATYANFIISNQYVILPTYAQAKDQLALERLATVFPNRQVLGVDALPVIRQHGSLHCLCMQYPKGALSKTL